MKFHIYNIEKHLIDTLFMPNSCKPKITVLFICTENSARSQIAEALLRHKANERFEVYSAGTTPSIIDPRTLLALETFAIPTSSLLAKSITYFESRQFDYVITLCDQANQECRAYPYAVNQLAWDLPDPKTRSGLNPFLMTINELNNRLIMFLKVINNTEQTTHDELTKNTFINEQAQPVHFDPIVFYKCLTDETRLKTLMLANYHGELCVCELMIALNEQSQPKVSRNLAVLKKANIITDRKNGQWVFYQINPFLPDWAKAIINQTTESNIALITDDLKRLAVMHDRPDKVSFCR
ncbi:metalloregulator ArsR/SmtB family transcription factor [Pseudoalteromonas porphyrae]|nr:metalloregulator ArsR/SmtB family transcription factor [Pseudoalteromonas porphyrae]